MAVGLALGMHPKHTDLFTKAKQIHYNIIFPSKPFSNQDQYAKTRNSHTES